MKKILLLNGPPRSGKDTMAEWFAKSGWTHMKFSKVLKERTHELYGLKGRPYDYYEDVKDDPHPDFYGISPRDAYINTSELLMKPVHGENIWARMLADQIQKEAQEYVVISDLGFQVEWETFIETFGYEKLGLTLLYRDGCSFENDSRDYVLPRGPWEYIDSPGEGFQDYIMFNCFDVENGGTLEHLYEYCQSIEDIVLGKKSLNISGSGKAIGQVGNASIG